jgi:hypothetical protein
MRNHFFDLNPFNSIKPYHIKSKSGQAIYFNFCSNVETTCQDNEALVVSKERCKRFSENANQEKTWTLSENNKSTVLTVDLPEGDVCERKINGIVKFQTSFEITCDKNVNDVVVTNEKEFNPKQCHNIIKIRSKYGNMSLIDRMFERKISSLVESIWSP